MARSSVKKAEERPRMEFDRDIAKFTERQMQAVRSLDGGVGDPPSPVKFVLYGGALGGG